MFRKFSKATILVLLLLVIASFYATTLYAAVAATDEAVLGNSRWRVTKDGTLIPESGSGMQVIIEVFDTSGDTLTASESSKRCIFTPTRGAYTTSTSPYQFNLPDAEVGLEFTVTVASNAYVSVNPQDGDTIVYGGASAGDKVQSSGNTDDTLTVTCGAANTWYVTDIQGTWTDQN